MADVYRDPLVALRDRAGGLELQLAQLQTRLAPEVERLLPRQWAQTLQRDRDEVERLRGARDSQEGLLALADALQRYVADLEQLVAQAAEIEARLRALPATAPEPPVRLLATSFQHEAEDLQDCLDRLWRLLSSLAPRVQATTLREGGLRGVRATFRLGQTPLALLYQGYAVPFDAFQPTALMVATNVAQATPRLALRPELARHVLLKPLGLTRDIELGAEQFDGLFIVDAEPDDARLLLTPEVRQGLLQIARYDIPHLEVGDGQATLRWRYAPELFTIKAAARVLAGLRAAPLRIKLLR
jgi:hypothetical protein